MKRLPKLLLLGFTIIAPSICNAQVNPSSDSTFSTFYEYCFFNELAKKNVYGLSFVAHIVYDEQLNNPKSYVIIAGEKPNLSDLSKEETLTPEEAVAARDFLQRLLDSADSHPKGITRMFVSSSGLVIRAYDWGKQYRVDFSCSSGYKATIYENKELREWIDGFDTCLQLLNDFRIPD